MDTESMINGQTQKWCTEPCGDAYVVIDFKGKVYTVCAVGIKSADDIPARDPNRVVISCKSAGDNEEIKLAEYNVDF